MEILSFRHKTEEAAEAASDCNLGVPKVLSEQTILTVFVRIMRSPIQAWRPIRKGDSRKPRNQSVLVKVDMVDRALFEGKSITVSTLLFTYGRATMLPRN